MKEVAEESNYGENEGIAAVVAVRGREGGGEAAVGRGQRQNGGEEN